MNIQTTTREKDMDKITSFSPLIDRLALYYEINKKAHPYD